MTPQLMQAIKLLQLSNLDLAAYVEGELERNPCWSAPAKARASPPRSQETATSATARGGRWPADWTGPTIGERTSRTADRGGSTPSSITSFPTTAARQSARSAADAAGLFRVVRHRRRRPRGRRLQSRGLRLGREPRSPIISPSSSRSRSAIRPRRMIGQYLIDMVDEAGYLTGDLARSPRSSAPRRRRRSRARGPADFDPPGVCARNLTECLAIQLKERDRFDPAMQALVGHLDLLAKRDLRRCAASAASTRISRHDRRDPHAQSEARPRLRLDAGAADRAGRVRARRRPTAAGWSSSIPTRCRRFWSTRATMRRSPKTAKNDKDKAYLADCLQTATWLIRALDQRAKTILKVATEIVRQQDAFFATACSICGRSISRPSPTPSACTNRRCRASPPTSTWRPAAASSS